jgi:hypothetical protein
MRCFTPVMYAAAHKREGAAMRGSLTAGIICLLTVHMNSPLDVQMQCELGLLLCYWWLLHQRTCTGTQDMHIWCW